MSEFEISRVEQLGRQVQGVGEGLLGAKVMSVGVVKALRSHMLYAWFSWAMNSRVKTNQERREGKTKLEAQISVNGGG